MKLALSKNVGCMRFLWRTEVPKMLSESAYTNFGAVPVFLLPDAKHAGLAMHHWCTDILAVCRARYVAQVAKAVISSGAVSVVKLLARPFTEAIEPCKAMRSIGAPINAKPYVPPIIQAGWGVADAASVCARDAREDSSIAVVIEKLTQAFAGKIGFSHDAPVKRIGQRPASVFSTELALLF